MFQEMELSGPKIKNFLTFSQKYFFIFREVKICLFQQGTFSALKVKKLSYISGNRTFWPLPLDFLYFFLKKPTLKKFLIFPQKKAFLTFREYETPIFWEIELFSCKYKKFQ